MRHSENQSSDQTITFAAGCCRRALGCPLPPATVTPAALLAAARRCCALPWTEHGRRPVGHWPCRPPDRSIRSFRSCPASPRPSRADRCQGGDAPSRQGRAAAACGRDRDKGETNHPVNLNLVYRNLGFGH